MMPQAFSNAVFWAHYSACSIMVGVIWYVQIVHYPLFHHIGLDAFVGYETLHRAKTTLVVAGPMLIEAFSAVMLLYARPAWMPAWSAWVGLGLVLVLWVATIFGSIPAHMKLSAGYHADVTNSLIAWNWIRTLAWTIRWAGLSYFMAQALH
jgi:hypothetical protein